MKVFRIEFTDGKRVHKSARNKFQAVRKTGRSWREIADVRLLTTYIGVFAHDIHAQR